MRKTRARQQKKITRQRIEKRKREIQRRLNRGIPDDTSRPMFSASNIQYEIAEKTRAIECGGIGLMLDLAKTTGLVDAINRKVSLLKLHVPYHESDHVLNIAFNALCGGRCLEDIERRRNDVTYLDALGTDRIPDPTTEGDFCRRFKSPYQVQRLQEAIDEARLTVWSRQPTDFFDQAIIDMDGHIVETTGACKEGMDISYDGRWGYHPLIVSLANTEEVLRIVNRSGNRPSHEGAAKQCDHVIDLCRQAGFRKVLLRGDTDFSQTEHLDEWDAQDVTFHFGYDAVTNLKGKADDLPESAWKPLERPARYEVRTKPRRRPDNIKEEIVVAREFENQRLKSEQVAEFPYRPTACKKTYRMIVIRKNISMEKGERLLFDTIRYFFYITNDENSPPSEIVFSCNDRCDQENLIEQLKNGPRAMRAAVDNLWSNGAYMVMTALAWNLKAWWALWLPESPGRWQEKHREEKKTLLTMDFRTFQNAMIWIPCQILHTGRQLVYRLLNWNPWQRVFFRMVYALRC
jgi:hypothetical protein